MNHTALQSLAKAGIKGKGKQLAHKAAPLTSSQQTLQELVVMRVAYERKEQNGRSSQTLSITKDSFPV